MNLVRPRSPTSVARMVRRHSRSLLTAFVVTAATVLLAGCFSVDSTFTIHDDATADIEYVVLIDTEQLETLSGLLGEEMGDMGDMSGDAMLEEMMGGEDPCGDLEGELSGFEVETTEIKEGSQVGLKCIVKGVPLEELNSSMQDDESTFTIEQDDTGTRFNATLQGVDELAGDADDMTQMTEMLDMSLDDIFKISFTVSAPGSLGEHNATSTDGSTATWNVTPDADFVVDGDAQMTAEWSAGSDSSSSSTIWIILGIIAAVLIVGGLVFFLTKRGKDNGGTDNGGTDNGGDVPVAAAPLTAPPVPPTVTPPPTGPATPPPPPPPA